MRTRKRSFPFIRIFLFFLLAGTVVGGYFLYPKWNLVSPPSSTYAVINWDKLWEKLPAMGQIRQQLNERLHAYHEEFFLHEKKLRAMQNHLMVLQKKMNPKDFKQSKYIEKLQKNFSDTVNATQKKAEERQKKVNDEYQNSLKNLKAQIHQTIKKIAHQKNIMVVLDASQLAYFDPKLDITPVVLETLKS